MQVHLLIENKKLRDINPLLAGEEDCLPGHAFGPAIREHYLLHYVFSGKGKYTVGERTTSVGAGQLFVIRPNEITFYQADDREPWHYCWVGFETSLDLGQWAQRDVVHAPACVQLFRDICACEHNDAQKEYYLCAKIYELIARLNQPAVALRDSSYEYVQRAKNYIESNYANPIIVADLAASLNLNRSYFTACFKRYLGKSPQQYIVDYRLGKAAELLCKHHLTPTEAARACGYTDLFNFSKMFKRRYGMAPTAYVKQACVQMPV